MVKVMVGPCEAANPPSRSVCLGSRLVDLDERLVLDVVQEQTGRPSRSDPPRTKYGRHAEVLQRGVERRVRLERELGQ